MNCSLSVGRSMKIRAIRGAPRLPVELYSPRMPVVKMLFINMCDKVSTHAGVMSPNFLSTFHTFIPIGIFLSECSESPWFLPEFKPL